MTSQAAVHAQPQPTVSGPPVDATSVVSRLRNTFESGRTLPVDARRRQLAGIAALLKEREGEIFEALRADLGKPMLEAYAGELAYTARELKLMARKLPGWMRPKRVPTPLSLRPGRSFVIREPLGVVLIIAPWNYPFHLAMTPLIGALAAGNSVVLKPSEVAPATSALLARLIPSYVTNQSVQVVEGGVHETTELLKQRFDHIFYTGNGSVGRTVLEAAAKHLTPVTLELGGKSPCIVDSDVDLEVAARRIVWGKFFNAGQTCVAPDYVLVHESREEELLAALEATVREFYGDDPRRSPDYARVVNSRHLSRLARLLDSGTVVCGGELDVPGRYLAPTVLRNVPKDSPVMAEEVFGPILPVLPVRSLDEAVKFVNERPKPLALYVFSSNAGAARRVVERTSSGGAGVNQACLQVGVPDLPFGGVGPSGMGAYHGRLSFETFTHKKSLFERPTYLDPRLMYPPYREETSKWLRRVM